MRIDIVVPKVSKYQFVVRDGQSLDPSKEMERIRTKHGPLVKVEVPIEKLQWTNEVVSSKVSGMVEQLESGGSLPAIVCEPGVGGSLHVVDGNHRVAAMLRVGRHTIDAWVPKSYGAESLAC